MKASIHCLLFYCLFSTHVIGQQSGVKFEELKFDFDTITGLEPEKGICRRDPSDLILVDGIYYLWYTKTEKQYSGYDASIWYAISKDGDIWEEQSEALQRGEAGSWDAYSVFTPNILKAEDKYYLFYTGVKPTPGNIDGLFENNSKTDFTAIGLAVADHPGGPFRRASEKPILTVSEAPENFDSYRVDDACLIIKDNQYWLYYKGRSIKYGQEGPRHTKMGVAISDKPEGPYKKYSANPIITSGHEVMVWPFGQGLMTLLSAHGPEGKTLQYSVDGINFAKVASFGDDYPKAPGLFRRSDFGDGSNITSKNFWGISMYYGDKEQWPYLLKYKLELVD